MPKNRSDDPSLCACICVILCFTLWFLIFFAFPASYLIFLCIFLPQDIKFTTYQASLTQFNLTNTTLFYDLSFNVSIRNPNHKPVGIYLYKMEAEASHDDRKFATAPVSLPSMPYYLGHKNTTFVHPFFRGQQLLSSEDYNKIIKMYNSEASTGVFSIVVKLDLQGRLRFGKIKTPLDKYQEL
ncbi:hypothetical protein UlMin_012503 [Ulmus minor]